MHLINAIMGCLFISLVIFGCEKNDAANSEEEQVLTCGSTLPTGFQCISASGKSTLTTTNIPELYGCWDSKSFDFCVEYKSNGTGIITYKPSSFVAGSTQNIKWGAMVKANGDLLLSNVGTIYIAHESLQGSIDPQIALLSFKQSTKQWYGFDLVTIGKCETITGGGTSTGGTGNIVFWTNSDLGCGVITVKVNNQTGSISSYHGTSPVCGAAGTANFTLPAGNYTYTAECSKYKWTSTFTITAGSCFKMQLT